jgi:hypothetical protein
MNGGPIREKSCTFNCNPESQITWAAFYSLTIPIHAIFRPSAGFHPDPWAACVAPRRGGAPSVDGGSSGLVLNKIVRGELSTF